MYEQRVSAGRYALERLTPGNRMMCATGHIENEVRRRGFAKYFSRFGRHVALEAIRGYRLIGAECHADLVEAALASHDRGETDATTFAALEDALRDLDRPQPLKLEYMRAHPHDFTHAGAG